MGERGSMGNGPGGAEASTSGRGNLRIYLGAAPGVGKTYAMLNEGHRLRDEGVDVVVGLVETHGRAETAERLDGLELIPRRRILYRSVLLEEMDIDAILARRPNVVLVDELAHTNAPGSRRRNRWEDVEALRDAGIHVITTLNIQHVAELGDVVAGITGGEVRATVPDRVLDEATDIQLVDLPVEALITRLEQGKIYPPERVQQALSHFFREGNLTALRELALRRTAEDVTDRLSDLMLTGTDIVAEASERVIVLMCDAPAWGDVLRNAWRLASALHAGLVVLEALPAIESRALAENRELATDLGARLVAVEAGLPGEESVALISGAVRAELGTVLVLGVRAARSRRFWPRARTSDLGFVEAIMRALPDVDIHLVRMDPPPVR